jgi:hypothetical protein
MSMVVAVAGGVATARERFYVRMAAVFIAVAVVGFAPTYWIPMLRGTLDVPPFAHVHAAVFYGWTLLFLKQTLLAASGRAARHRELGVAGVALATAMLFVGLAMSVSSLRRFDAGGLSEAGRAFSIVSFTAIALFCALFVVAVVNVRKPDVHKRFMLVATVSLLQAAIARWFVYFLAPDVPAGVLAPPPPITVTILPAVLANLLVVWAMLHDRRTIGHVHRAYWLAGAALVATQVVRLPLSTTDAWSHVAGWLLAVAP